MRYYIEVENNIERVRVIEEDGAIVAVQFARETAVEEALEYKTTPVLQEAKRQLEEYFAGKRTVFDLPLNPTGTVFQKQVWAQLQQIPYGETRSYSQIATAIGNPKASRAVGGANNKNPIGIIVPCHRVIGANGALVGYAGGLDLKEKLLQLERDNI